MSLPVFSVIWADSGPPSAPMWHPVAMMEGVMTSDVSAYVLDLEPRWHRAVVILCDHVRTQAMWGHYNGPHADRPCLGPIPDWHAFVVSGLTDVVKASREYARDSSLNQPSEN